MKETSPTRRTGLAGRRPGTRGPLPVPARTRALKLLEREAAVLAGEQASLQRREAADRRETAADRREATADRRDAAARVRAEAHAQAVKAGAAAVVQLRKVNARLVVSTVAAQTRTEAAEQVTAAMALAAQHDCLTGLPNRSLLADRLERSIAFARRQGHRVALLFLDLDHFKEVNDTLGHPAGDLLLKSIASRLLACVRQTDTVCRQGGDEFVLLLPEINQPEDAILTARKVIAAMVPAHELGAHQVAVTLSLGISLFPEDGADPETLVEAADIAMYYAKRSGRNNFQVFTQALGKAAGVRRRPARKPR